MKGSFPQGPNKSSTKYPSSESLLICTGEENDNERGDGWGGERRAKGSPDQTWRLEWALLPQEDREIEGRQRRMNKAMLLHFNQPLPSHMAAEHPEGRRRHAS